MQKRFFKPQSGIQTKALNINKIVFSSWDDLNTHISPRLRFNFYSSHFVFTYFDNVVLEVDEVGPGHVEKRGVQQHGLRHQIYKKKIEVGPWHVSPNLKKQQPGISLKWEPRKAAFPLIFNKNISFLKTRCCVYFLFLLGMFFICPI